MANHAEEPLGADVAREGTKSRFERARNSYDQILNRLWAGNSAGAIVATGSLGSGKITDTLLLWALSAFLGGVLALGIGSVVRLIGELVSLRDWEEANSIYDVKLSNFRRPSEEAGLRLNFENVLALCSALTFVAGTICGLVVAVKGFR